MYIGFQISWHDLWVTLVLYYVSLPRYYLFRFDGERLGEPAPWLEIDVMILRN